LSLLADQAAASELAEADRVRFVGVEGGWRSRRCAEAPDANGNRSVIATLNAAAIILKRGAFPGWLTGVVSLGSAETGVDHPEG
jgi:hypothetical protein